MLTITRHNSESGSIQGTIKTKNGPRQIDYSWNSHELWINGRLNPEDHPFEQKAMDIFEEADSIIAANWTKTCEDKADIPFTAKYTKSQNVHDLQILLEIDEAQARIWHKDFKVEDHTFLQLLEDNVPLDLNKHKNNLLLNMKATKGTNTFILPEGGILANIS